MIYDFDETYYLLLANMKCLAQTESKKFFCKAILGVAEKRHLHAKNPIFKNNCAPMSLYYRAREKQTIILSLLIIIQLPA